MDQARVRNVSSQNFNEMRLRLDVRQDGQSEIPSQFLSFTSTASWDISTSHMLYHFLLLFLISFSLTLESSLLSHLTNRIYSTSFLIAICIAFQRSCTLCCSPLQTHGMGSLRARQRSIIRRAMVQIQSGGVSVLDLIQFGPWDRPRASAGFLMSQSSTLAFGRKMRI